MEWGHVSAKKCGFLACSLNVLGACRSLPPSPSCLWPLGSCCCTQVHVVPGASVFSTSRPTPPPHLWSSHLNIDIEPGVIWKGQTWVQLLEAFPPAPSLRWIFSKCSWAFFFFFTWMLMDRMILWAHSWIGLLDMNQIYFLLYFMISLVRTWSKIFFLWKSIICIYDTPYIGCTLDLATCVIVWD